MSEAPNQFVPGSVHPLAQAPKHRWELGQIRHIAAGALNSAGHLQAAQESEWTWHLSVRSIEKAGSFDTTDAEHTLTLIAGDFIQLESGGRQFGLEPFRPLKLETSGAVSSSQPGEEILELHLLHLPARVRATVRIVELSKKREQYLFDGQLGFMVQGSASLACSTGDSSVQLRDTVIGSDAAEVRLRGRGLLAVVSLDPANS